MHQLINFRNKRRDDKLSVSSQQRMGDVSHQMLSKLTSFPRSNLKPRQSNRKRWAACWKVVANRCERRAAELKQADKRSFKNQVHRTEVRQIRTGHWCTCTHSAFLKNLGVRRFHAMKTYNIVANEIRSQYFSMNTPKKLLWSQKILRRASAIFDTDKEKIVGR